MLIVYVMNYYIKQGLGAVNHSAISFSGFILSEYKTQAWTFNCEADIVLKSF